MAEQGHERVSIWAMAGLRVQTNRVLRRCRRVAGASWDVEVLFDRGAAEPERALWHRSPPGVPGWIRADGRRVRIEERGEPAADPGAEIRRVLPYTAALQGRVMLHAAAVAAGDGIHAFVGPSGAGKSTLAGELARQGAAVVADDLLLCRERRGAVVASIEDTPAVGDTTLAGIHFLERTAGLERPRSTPVSRPECFRRLLRHGFGELEVAQVWALQFDVFQRIAARARGFALELPDDLGRLAEAAGILIREQLSGAAPATGGRAR